jgi:hypothetical protein
MGNGGEHDLQGFLRRCTVQVFVDGVPNGTGFFVAPGVVVTCAHVVRPELAQGGVEPTITILDASRGEHAPELDKVWPEEMVDLALLRVPLARDQPCVLLEPSLSLDDRLYSYGFPEDHLEGEPTAFRAEGETGHGWAKLAGGQAKHGASGSPLLNIRTGAVHGVLKRTRNSAVDLGGYAISAQALYEREPGLQGLNQSFHQKDSRWRELLTTEQRRALAPFFGRQTPEPSKLFVLTIGLQGSGWTVGATIYPAGEPLAPVAVDLNGPRVAVARLFRDWAARGRVQEAEQVRLLGGILFRALFQDSIRARFGELLAQKEEEPFSIALCFRQGTDADLVHLPWEYAYVPAEENVPETYLAADRFLRFVRSQLSNPEVGSQPPTRSLAVLLVAMRPPDSNEDMSWISRHLEHVPGVQVIERPTVEVLSGKLESGDFDVVHYVGFGRFHSYTDELALGGEDGRTYHGVEEFALGFGTKKPRLAVLQLCRGPADDVPADAALLAPTLLRHGIPAVLAYQTPLAPAHASAFTKALYEELANGRSVEAAVQEGRHKLQLRSLGTRAFVSPALFVRSPGTHQLTAATREAATQQPVFSSYG